jgi:WD40 repeat protein
VRAVAFAPDGRQFATGGADGRILLYDAPPAGAGPGELRERVALDAHRTPVACLSFSHDGRLLSSGSDALRKGPAEVKVWDTMTGSEVAAFPGHTAGVAAVAFHPSRPLLVSGGADPGYRVWDLASKKALLFRPTQTAVLSLVFTAGGKELLTGSAGQALLAWDTEGWQEQARFVGHKGVVTGLFVTGAGPDQTIFSTGTDQSVRAWSLRRAAIVGTRFAGHESWVTSLVLMPDGKKLVSGSWDGTLRIWDVEKGKDPVVLEGHEAKIFTIAVSRDGKRAASAGGNGEAIVWNLESEALLAKLEGYDEEAEVNGVAFTPDGKRVWTASSDGDIRVWDAESGKELGRIKGPRDGLQAFALSPDGRRLIASGGAGNACVVYDVETKKELFRLRGHTGTVHVIAFSPDGSRILTGAADRTLRLWDAATGAELHKYDAHGGYVRGVSFTPDGKTAASVGYDHVNRVWDLESGRTLAAFEVHDRPALAVAISADGKTVFSGGADSYVVRWRADAPPQK